MAAAARLGVSRDTPWLAERIGGWKAAGTFTRGALFALGVVAAGLSVAIAALLHVPGPFLVAGLALVAVAEQLIERRRLFGAGVEEALEVVGLLLIGFALVDGSGTAFEIRLALALALALLAAGLRFLNPLFTTLAVATLSFALDLIVSTLEVGALSRAVIVAVFCFAAAAVALGLGAARLRRPAHDAMLDWLVVAMPVAGYLWLEGRSASALAADPRQHLSVASAVAIAMPALFGALSLRGGIRRRRHAPILAGMACAGCVGYALRHVTGLALEVRLIVWGSAALVLALALDRYLRTPRAGITSRDVGLGKDALGLLQLVGAGALTPSATQPPGAPFKGAGGGFDGGGASGGY